MVNKTVDTLDEDITGEEAVHNEKQQLATMNTTENQESEENQEIPPIPGLLPEASTGTFHYFPSPNGPINSSETPVIPKFPTFAINPLGGKIQTQPTGIGILSRLKCLVPFLSFII